MITLPETPHLAAPTATVRISYVTGEQADCLLRGTPTESLRPASEDFDRFVAERRGVRTRWEVPSTVFWYVSGEHWTAATSLVWRTRWWFGLRHTIIWRRGIRGRGFPQVQRLGERRRTALGRR